MSNTLRITPAEIAKALVAVIGAAAEAVNAGLVSGSAAKWVAIGIGLATALGVYVTPNRPQATK